MHGFTEKRLQGKTQIGFEFGQESECTIESMIHQIAAAAMSLGSSFNMANALRASASVL